MSTDFSTDSNSYTDLEQQPNKITQIQEQLVETKAILSDNIDLVINRGVRIDTLVIKSDELQTDATKFNRFARNLKKKFCCKYGYNTGILVTILIIAILLLVIIIRAST